MSRRKITIKSRLIISALLIIVMLLSTIFAARYYVQQSQILLTLKNRLEKINSLQMEMQILEKNFLYSESINSEFYSKGAGQVILSFSEKQSETGKIIQYLISNDIITKNNLIEVGS